MPKTTTMTMIMTTATTMWICHQDNNKMELPLPGPLGIDIAVASVPTAAEAPPDNDDAKDDNNNNDDDNANNNVDLPRDDNKMELLLPGRLVIDIAGIASGDRGCKCREHNVCCGEVLDVDIVVRLRREEILVPDDFLSEGNMRKETAITVNWVTSGFEQCRVGFLPPGYVVDAACYDGALYQVIEVFDIAKYSRISQSSCAKQAKWNKHNGFACGVVISKLNSNIVRKVKGMKVKVAPVKGN
jgi:hypothetical protein